MLCMYGSTPAMQPNTIPRAPANVQAQTQAVQAAQAAQLQAQRIRVRNHYDILVGEGFRGTKRDRPTDRSLPPSIKRQVKESAVYADLQRMERNLDWTMARKRAELMESMGKPPKVCRDASFCD